MSIALIVGAGRPLTEALVTAFLERFDTVVLTTRSLAGGADFAAGKEARIIQCDATRAAEVADLFGKVDELGEPLEVATYLPSAGFRGSITALPAHAASNAMEVSAGGAFMIAREAAKRMVPQRRGALFFVGATASSKGFAKSAPFAMGKFALRGLTQSLARELHPKNVHVSHIVVDGMIEDEKLNARSKDIIAERSFLRPDAVVQTFFQMLDQHPSAWSSEITIRPAMEEH